MHFLIAIALVFTIGIAVLLYAFAMFDRLVRAQYVDERIQWESDGRPRGFFWRASECTWLSGWASNRLAFVWLFKTPQWAKSSSTNLLNLRHLRISVLTWHVLVLSVLLFGVLIA